MAKHFLVTISNDVDNLFGVQFLCLFFQAMAQCQVTLFHICRLDAPDMKAELLKMWDGPSDGIEGYVSIGARNSLDQATRLLQDRRMHVDQMITKTVAERGGKVRDILAEGSRGLYDAIVLGHRASYTLQWLVERPADEIAQALIRDNTCTLPLWICPRIDPQRRGVLVCLDGSEHAYRAVDHVGYILAGQVHQPVTLLQVTSVLGSGDEAVFDRAVGILHRHGIENERIERRAVWGLSVAGTILSEAEKGGYAAVAVGFGGSGAAGGETSSFRLLGGTTSRLICKNESTSLWCCP
ncbi:universal stress protein [Desulfofustis glycolicus]|uniref:Universal stress protein family protein n=1 Tax=Desulfofustis glycolicus DSM 9705 TaxID=1121409 RepID=A0A1M5VUM6_9BACT|nr:universal stress protein [Desulfofustis glycolicus]SHH78907.1 Universal stress protein family protein [Desulfofustis glycolicus DSM 9705]